MQNIPKIVLKRLYSPPAESHPDADLLTAFAEQSLAGSERDHVVEHLARCGECREALARALPAEADLPARAESSANWFRRKPLRGSALRWATLAVGAIVIASIGTLQYRRQHVDQLASSGFHAEQAVATPSPSPQPSSQMSAPQTGMQKDTLAAIRAHSRNSIHGSVLAGVLQNPAPSAAAKQNPSPGSAHRAVVPSAAQVVEGQTETAQVTTQPAAENQLQDQIIQNAQQLQPSADQFEAVDKAKPASAQSALAPAPPLHTEPSLLKSLATPRWSINTTGTLQRSLDGGNTWLDVSVVVDESISPPRSGEKKSASAEPTIFRALSVSSNATEVWAGGSGGTLYHTIDGGNRWARVVPSAAGVVLSGDILSIQFSDQRNGTVATSTPEVWTTVDDGQTWRQQP